MAGTVRVIAVDQPVSIFVVGAQIVAYFHIATTATAAATAGAQAPLEVSEAAGPHDIIVIRIGYLVG